MLKALALSVLRYYSSEASALNSIANYLLILKHLHRLDVTEPSIDAASEYRAPRVTATLKQQGLEQDSPGSSSRISTRRTRISATGSPRAASLQRTCKIAWVRMEVAAVANLQLFRQTRATLVVVQRWRFLSPLALWDVVMCDRGVRQVLLNFKML